jgi:acetylornithine/succinyldiaminopimelate/putrescine aminotransferase
MVTARSERRFLARDMPSELQVARTSGSFLIDARGRRYVDFVMGWCVGNLGWGHEAAAKAIAGFKGPDYVYPGYSYRRWTELGALIASIAPGTLTKCFRATGGSEAVDIALQAAFVHTRRQKILSLEGSYHGNSIAGLSVGSSDTRESCPNLLRHCHRIAPPLDEKALDKFERRLKHRDVAAVIMEPISINLGVLIPSREWMAELQRLCTKFRTLLIMDEVATGFGRTGTLFATEQFAIAPDIMCVAKAITGGASGMGAVIATPAVARSMEENGTFYSTYGWHPRSVEAAIATLRYIVTHRTRLLEHVARTSDYFLTRLSQFAFKDETAIRMRGLAIAVDVKDEDYAGKVQQKCRKNGLLVSTEETSILLLPALNIERQVAERGLDILEGSL